MRISLPREDNLPLNGGCVGVRKGLSPYFMLDGGTGKPGVRLIRDLSRAVSGYLYS